MAQKPAKSERGWRDTAPQPSLAGVIRLPSRPALVQVALYGAALAAGTMLLDWIDLRRAARFHGCEVYLFLLAAGFLLLGLWAGARLFGPAPPPPPGNPAAQVALGISARELEVLQALAAGRSNKEIALALGISPNTVKTHVARLFEKLDARRRTDALARARALGLLP